MKFTEVIDKRLLTATPKGKKRSIFADNSKHVYVAGVGVSRTTSGVFVSDIIVTMCWFEIFALQNLQAFSKLEVTSVNVYMH